MHRVGKGSTAANALAEPITLPCGRRIPNRLVKAALEELLSWDRLPDERFERLYRSWSRGGFGMILSGNVQVSSKHLGLPFDVAVPERNPSRPLVEDDDDDPFARFTAWARSMSTDNDDDDDDEDVDGQKTSQGPVRILQLNHPGRQSMRGVFTGRSWFDDEPALAPSVVPMTAGGRDHGFVAKLIAWLVWGTNVKAMDCRDVDRVVEQFRKGARWARETGWDGVQLHASHGYLLSQFLSPHTNRRTDEFGGTARRRIEILFRIADAIRRDYPLESGFVLGVKLNASDYIKGGLTEEDALDNVRWIAEHGGFDFIEISGGSYEAPEFLSKKASTAKREAFFAKFASRAHRLLQDLEPARLPTPKPLILLTGGFRTRRGMHRALVETVTDLIGIGRPAAVDPHFALKLVDPTVADDDARMPAYDTGEGSALLRTLFGWITLAGPSFDVLYHTLHMHAIARARRRRRGRGGRDPFRHDAESVRRRLVPISILARRTYVDPIISPTWQLAILWSVVGLLTWYGMVSTGVLRPTT